MSLSSRARWDDSSRKSLAPLALVSRQRPVPSLLEFGCNARPVASRRGRARAGLLARSRSGEEIGSVERRSVERMRVVRVVVESEVVVQIDGRVKRKGIIFDGVLVVVEREVSAVGKGRGEDAVEALLAQSSAERIVHSSILFKAAIHGSRLSPN